MTIIILFVYETRVEYEVEQFAPLRRAMVENYRHLACTMAFKEINDRIYIYNESPHHLTTTKYLVLAKRTVHFFLLFWYYHFEFYSEKGTQASCQHSIILVPEIRVTLREVCT